MGIPPVGFRDAVPRVLAEIGILTRPEGQTHEWLS
jgi:hypothetical protein